MTMSVVGRGHLRVTRAGCMAEIGREVAGADIEQSRYRWSIPEHAMSDI
jgi:UDP-glucose 6-dehydrogenase